MLRTRLLIAFAALLGPSLIMGFLLSWGPREIEHRLERSLLAHNQVQMYLQLALNALRDLQHLGYGVMLGQPVRQEEAQARRQALGQQLKALRHLTLDELAFVGDTEPEEREELDRITRFEQLLEDEFGVLASSGAAENPEGLRRQIDLLDRRLGALMEEVIEDEAGEASVADGQTRQLIERLTVLAGSVVLVAAACAIVTALWVRRRIQVPIDALAQGTRRIASDGLDHRVHVSGRDELANLAVSFNWMAAELEKRRHALDRSRAELERKVRERTRELQHSNQTLRRMDEARRQMFADISHALRTPLTVIQGEAEVTLRARDCEGSACRIALQRIVETTGQLNRLVEDLLLVARAEAVAPSAEATAIAAGALIHELGDDAKALAAAKAIRVTCSLPRANVWIRGDADRLRQVLLILVDNACRYTQAGGEITLELIAKAPEAILTVSDTGIGIPPDELDLVVGRFYRGSNAPDLAPKGTGLGLYVARSIVEAHGGRLEVESELGGGTRVTVRLPLAEMQDPVDERTAG
jgi:two-component system, OmpR family, sensor kinase